MHVLKLTLCSKPVARVFNEGIAVTIKSICLNTGNWGGLYNLQRPTLRKRNGAQGKAVTALRCLILSLFKRIAYAAVNVGLYLVWRRSIIFWR